MIVTIKKLGVNVKEVLVAKSKQVVITLTFNVIIWSLIGSTFNAAIPVLSTYYGELVKKVQYEIKILNDTKKVPENVEKYIEDTHPLED